MRRTRTALVISAAVVGQLLQSAAVRAESPAKSPRVAKVFILAGQSNMVGDGRVGPAETKGTLAYMVQKSDRRGQFQHLVDAQGNWAERSDVWYFQRQTVREGRGAAQTTRTVDITSGLKPGLQGAGDRLTIGPELQFGHVMGDHLDVPVLLIKTAWGGKSLAIDFRPPSAGEPTFELSANKQGVKPDVGAYYRRMIGEVRNLQANAEKYFPGFGKLEVEIVGFCWHQGWNDGCNADFSAEYEKNLPLLIADVRKDLGVADLPVVIASSGFGGHDENLPGVRARIKQVVEPAQIAASKKMENVTCVETRDFFRPREESPTGASYHWNSNAETYFLIGDAMGRAMIELLSK